MCTRMIVIVAKWEQKQPCNKRIGSLLWVKTKCIGFAFGTLFCCTPSPLSNTNIPSIKWWCRDWVHPASMSWMAEDTRQLLTPPLTDTSSCINRFIENIATIYSHILEAMFPGISRMKQIAFHNYDAFKIVIIPMYDTGQNQSQISHTSKVTWDL